MGSCPNPATLHHLSTGWPILTNYIGSAAEARAMDPTKDLAAYGYGSVAWKERVDSWKVKQGKMQMMMTEGGQLQASGKGGHPDDGGSNGPDLPM